MERTATYLNEISSSSHFYLVELVRFSDGEIDAFEARTVLKPARQAFKGSAAKYNMETFLAAEQNTDRRHLLRRLIDHCLGLGMSVFWGTSGISLKVHTTDSSTPLSVAWIFPTGVTGWMGLTGMSLGFDLGSAKKHPSFQGHLDCYAEAFKSLPNTTPASSKNLSAVTVEPAAEGDLIGQIEGLITDLATVAADQ